MNVEINAEVFYIICFLIRNGRSKIHAMSRDYIQMKGKGALLRPTQTTSGHC